MKTCQDCLADPYFRFGRFVPFVGWGLALWGMDATYSTARAAGMDKGDAAFYSTADAIVLMSLWGPKLEPGSLLPEEHMIIDKFYLNDPKMPGVFRVGSNGVSFTSGPNPGRIDVVGSIEEVRSRLQEEMDDDSQ